MNRVVNTFLAIAASLGLAGCTTVPETGRKQFNFLTPDQEMQMGLTSFQQLKQEVPVSKDTKTAALVERVGKRIAAVAPLPNAQWEFVLFESKEANAFCLPGGKVGVYTGILPYTKDEAGLATVIGHEVAHAVARHGGERVSQQLGLEVVGAVISSSMQESKWQAAAVTAYGLGSQVGYALPHSRMQESEADELGLLYMARAGYNPEAAVGFWQRFAELEARSGGTPGFLRTHPVSADRVQALQEMMPRALQEYRAHGGK
ncbi:MAG: M48 family metallopeptidase [Verrucomicrobia bacterium]|jgi:predicted Zn-dependent protease|nr:M48 family metallopeptidase [Verrucomicrobiota bacterium]